MVWAIARRHRLSAADAADVSQTTWLRLVEHLDRIEQPDRIRAWLATTARYDRYTSCALPLVRARPRTTTFHLVRFRRIRVHSAILTEVRDRELWELITDLPHRCQLLLQFLTDEARLSYVEMGEALKMPTGSIGPTRGRCLEHLRRLAASRGISLEYDASYRRSLARRALCR